TRAVGPISPSDLPAHAGSPRKAAPSAPQAKAMAEVDDLRCTSCPVSSLGRTLATGESPPRRWPEPSAFPRTCVLRDLAAEANATSTPPGSLLRKSRSEEARLCRADEAHRRSGAGCEAPGEHRTGRKGINSRCEHVSS